MKHSRTLLGFLGWLLFFTLAPEGVAQQKNKETGPPIGDQKAAPVTTKSSTDELPYSQLEADKVEPLKLPAPEMKRYQAVASAGAGWPQPSTVAEVPVNGHEDVNSPLTEKKAEFEPFNPDRRDVKLAVVWKQDRAQMSNEDLNAIYPELDKIWIGKPSDLLKVNGKGEVLFRDKPIWIVFGWREGNGTRFYDEGILERNNELFSRFAADILLPAKSETLHTSGDNPVCFAVFLDGKKVEDPAREKSLQEKIYWMLAGKSVTDMETDTWGNLYWREQGAAERLKVDLRYFNLTDRRLYLIKEAEQFALDNKFRRQTRYVLTVEVNKGQERIDQLQAANQKIARVQQILDLKRSIAREERQEELTEAELLVDEATRAWKTHGEGFPQYAAQVRKLAGFKTEVAYQLGRLSYPFTLELPEACDSYVLHQLDADTVNLYLRAARALPGVKASVAEPAPDKAAVPEEKQPEEVPELDLGGLEAGPPPLKEPKKELETEGNQENPDVAPSTDPDPKIPDLAKDDIMLAQFKGERIPFHCFDGAIAVFATWVPASASRLSYKMGGTNLSADELKTYEGPGLFVMRQNELVVAHKVDSSRRFDEFEGAGKRGQKTLARLKLDGMEDSFYEFSSDGSTFRERLRTPEDWDGYLFEKIGEDRLRAFQIDADGAEVELGALSYEDIKTINVVEGSLAFSTDVFEPSATLEFKLDGSGSTVDKEGIVRLKGSNAFYLIRGNALLFVRRAQEGQKIKEVRVGDLGEKTVFVARYEGDASYSHLLTPKADFFQSHFNFGAECRNYTAVIEDEKEIQLFWSGRENTPLVNIQGLGNVSCSGDGIAFFAKKLSYDATILHEKLKSDSNVSPKNIQEGLPENTLVVLHDDELRVLLQPFSGHKFQSLKASVGQNGSPVFLVGYEGEADFVAEISMEGAWLSPRHFGHAKLGYGLLDFPKEEKTLLFLHGRLIANVHGLTAAKAHGKTLAIIADGLQPVKGLEDRLTNRTDEELSAKNMLFVLNGNEVLSAMTSRSSREDEVYSSLGVEEIPGRGPHYRVWTSNNRDYTELLGVDGRNFRPWKHGEFTQEAIALDVNEPETVWAEEKKRQDLEAEQRHRDLMEEEDPFKEEPLEAPVPEEQN